MSVDDSTEQPSAPPTRTTPDTAHNRSSVGPSPTHAPAQQPAVVPAMPPPLAMGQPSAGTLARQQVAKVRYLQQLALLAVEEAAKVAAEDLDRFVVDADAIALAVQQYIKSQSFQAQITMLASSVREAS